MNITEWTAEDFVLYPGFRKWVWSPDVETNLVWEGYLSKNPEKLGEIKLAREILINLSARSYTLSVKDKEDLWKKVDLETESIQGEGNTREIVPLNANSTIKRMEQKQVDPFQFSQFYRVAAILVICFGLGFLAAAMLQEEEEIIESPLVYTEHIARPGVKSNLTLTDGSKVILNSGSKLYYVENFQTDKRELFLEGEAYFEVFKDSTRPFIVHTGTISTTALGTSFSINAYESEAINIYLLTGKVAVADQLAHNPGVFLERGEAALADNNGGLTKGKFDEERATAWTKGIILFDRTPIMEAIKIMENWYGVEFDLKNRPAANLTVSGKFHNELLQNILIGLSYSARFQFEIQEDKVKMDFTDP
jgi:ferric-dicitrate binding protein FerR (iron transport regulator)